MSAFGIKVNQYRVIAVISCAICLFWAGCESDSQSRISGGATAKLTAGPMTKAEAATELQSLIRNSKGTSVYHQGFKPKAKPPCPLPEWSPREIFLVYEDSMRTTYMTQHWRDEKKAGGYYTWERWSGYRDKVTSHVFVMNFADVTRMEIGKSPFSKLITFYIYYQPDNSIEYVFKLRFSKKPNGSAKEKATIKALKILCPQLR